MEKNFPYVLDFVFSLFTNGYNSYLSRRVLLNLRLQQRLCVPCHMVCSLAGPPRPDSCPGNTIYSLKETTDGTFQRDKQL